ncbi:hypothetical protein [Halorientalis salina]|uniref:hypothetical protein n=1 Tax=Halorientalis salina TaxID=2932266 RepID=UPI0010AC56F4|nr:hypothetical protein [Halorientalis salina]
MAQRQTGADWTVELDDGVMVWEFLSGMELSAFEAEAYRVYEELLANNAVDGMVTVVKLDDPFTEDVFSLWEKSAQRADEAGVERWAVVAEGIKSISLRGKISVGSIETYATEDRADALEWVRG